MNQLKNEIEKLVDGLRPQFSRSCILENKPKVDYSSGRIRIIKFERFDINVRLTFKIASEESIIYWLNDSSEEEEKLLQKLVLLQKLLPDGASNEN